MPDASSPEAVVVEWSARPADGRPGLALLVGAMIVGGAAIALQWLGSVTLAAIAALLLSIAVLPFYLRTHYRLVGGTLHVRTAVYRFERDLSVFRAFERGGRMLWLCTLTKPSVLDNYRGMGLLVSGNADAVAEALLALGLEERTCAKPA